jgi:hypothetical protein
MKYRIQGHIFELNLFHSHYSTELKVIYSLSLFQGHYETKIKAINFDLVYFTQSYYPKRWIVEILDCFYHCIEMLVVILHTSNDW